MIGRGLRPSGEHVDGALTVLLGRVAECLVAEDVFKELEEVTRPIEVGMVELPGYRIWQSQDQRGLPSEK
jgi:hypothetical protein